MVSHSKIVDSLYILHEICNFRSLKNMFLINILAFIFLNMLENVLMNLSYMDFFCTAAAVAEILTVCLNVEFRERQQVEPISHFVQAKQSLIRAH
jgi:hypothetical protein